MEENEKFILNGIIEYIEENVDFNNIYYNYGLEMRNSDFDINVFNNKITLINFLRNKNKPSAKKFNLDW